MTKLTGKVLVLDGRQRSALAAVRSLGESGLEVTVGEDRLPCLASRSNYAVRAIEYASPVTSPGSFIEDIRRELSSHDYDMLLPMTDITMYLVVNALEELSPLVKIPVPAKNDYLKAIDKAETLKLSRELGIPTPRTFIIEEIEELGRIGNEIIYPVVIKPGKSKYLIDGEWVSAGVDYAIDHDDLVRKLERYKTLPDLPLFQERISGPGIGAFFLFEHGSEKAAFFHRRIREKPPSGGVSVLRESIAPDPVVREYGIKLLKALNWHGVAMVEFKIDERDNSYRIMEINARFWGSLQLAIDSGVNFPMMLYKMITAGEVEANFDYRIGMKSRWLLGDFDHLLARLFKTRARLNLPAVYPGRIRTLFDFIKFYQPGTKYEIMRFNDIGPFLQELKEWFKQLSRG